MQTEQQNWLLLRGLARGSGHWGAFSTMLQEKFPNDRFEFLDLPGNGTENLQQSPWSIAGYVEQARARSQFVQEKKKFRILTLSLGAMVAVEWMRLYPSDVEQATLLCTSSRGFSPFLPPLYAE